MEFDLFTFGAQIVNFLILVIALKLVLFDKVREVIDTREKEINDRYDQAEEKLSSAEEEAGAYRKKIESINAEKKEILAQAREKADQQRELLEKKIRDEMDEKKRKWEESLQREKERFYRDLEQMTGEEIYSLSRKVLKDLSDYNLEEQVIDRFIGRLKSDEGRDTLARMDQDGTEEAYAVKSSFALSSEKKELLRQTLEGALGREINMEFFEHDDLICGLAVVKEGRKISWNINSYISEMEENFRAALNQRGG